MKKNYLWRKMTSGLMAAAVTVTAMPGTGRRKENIKSSYGVQLCSIQLDSAR